MKHAIKHIHLIGIGGAGMSRNRQLLHNLLCGFRLRRPTAARCSDERAGDGKTTACRMSWWSPRGANH
jgi:hypothetical protein